MRREAPVRFDEARLTWDVFRYKDVLALLKDHVRFSSVRPNFGPNLLASVLSTDPPKHAQLRGIVSRAFTAKTIADLQPQIEEISAQLLSEALPEGQMDLVQALAYPLPMIVIARLLGAPTADQARFKQWSDSIAKGAAENSRAALQKLLAEKTQTKQELVSYFTAIMAERRRQPQDDLITKLVQARVDGMQLSDLEICEFCILLLAAGNETTTNLIASAVRCCVEEPSLQEHLRRHPQAIEAAIEEVLRYYSPIQATNRYTTQAVEVAGQRLSAGQQVVLWIGSANRDEQQFADAERFMADREPNRHLAFGQGIHFCLGAPLARLEARLALIALLRHTSRLRYVSGTELCPLASSLGYGTTKLAIAFDAP